MKAINGSQLDVYGPKAHEELLQLIRTAMRSNDMATATETGLVLDAFADIRLAATRFIGEGDMSMVSEARGKVKTFVDLIDTLKSRSEEHTSELQSLMRISYAVFCLKKKKKTKEQKQYVLDQTHKDHTISQKQPVKR